MQVQTVRSDLCLREQVGRKRPLVLMFCYHMADYKGVFRQRRIYVHNSVYDEFASRLAEKVEAFKVGNGFESGTTHGPLIHSKAVEKTHKHVEDAKAKGAKVLVGGKKLTDLGENFYQPTILTDVQHCAIDEEETFGTSRTRQECHRPTDASTFLSSARFAPR